MRQKVQRRGRCRWVTASPARLGLAEVGAQTGADQPGAQMVALVAVDPLERPGDLLLDGLERQKKLFRPQVALLGVSGGFVQSDRDRAIGGGRLLPMGDEGGAQLFGDVGG